MGISMLSNTESSSESGMVEFKVFRKVKQSYVVVLSGNIVMIIIV